jgi:large subunit ribosomal protein L10
VNRREKEQVVSELHETLREFKAVIFTDFRGLNVEEITRLRKQLQEASVEYRVVKNTLMRIASKETSLEGLSDFFVGPTAMAVSNDDPLAPARVLSEFSKEIPMLEIKGGIVEGRVVGPRDIEGMAKLPGGAQRRTVPFGKRIICSDHQVGPGVRGDSHGSPGRG